MPSYIFFFHSYFRIIILVYSYLKKEYIVYKAKIDFFFFHFYHNQLFNLHTTMYRKSTFLFVLPIEEGILEAKTECYAKDKVKSPPFFFILLQQFLVIFFDNYLYIFHKTEVQTVILRCWTGLNHNWFKSYDTKRNAGEKE